MSETCSNCGGMHFGTYGCPFLKTEIYTKPEENSVNIQETAQVEMPQYLCHKKVWALKIKKVTDTPDGGLIEPWEEGYAAFTVSGDYMIRHNPRSGGYFVVYSDGYKSFSPAEPFDSGYTPIRTDGNDGRELTRAQARQIMESHDATTAMQVSYALGCVSVHPPKAEVEPDRECVENDGCPTEMAVLKRFWREQHKNLSANKNMGASPMCCCGEPNAPGVLHRNPEPCIVMHPTE